MTYACDMIHPLYMHAQYLYVNETSVEIKDKRCIFYSCFTDVEELLGKPVQAEFSTETGLDVALDALIDLGNGKNYNKNVFL